MFYKVKLSKITRLVLQYVVPLVALGYLAFEFYDLPKEHIELWTSEIHNNPSMAFMIGAVVVLSGANWFLEAAKWKFLAGKVEQIGLLRALAGVLYAIGLGFISPRQVGELMGKVVVLSRENQLQGLVMSSAGSFVQFCTTFFMGHAGLLVGVLVLSPSDVSILNQGLIGYSFLIGILSIGMLIFHGRVIRYLASLKLGEYLSKVLKAMGLLRLIDIRYVVLISVVRYFTFILQFHLLLVAFGACVSLVASGVVLSITYLIMAGIPVSGILDSGVRGSVALFVFQFFSQSFSHASLSPELYVVPAMVGLWAINIAIPGLIGVWIAINGKIFVKPNSKQI